MVRLRRRFAALLVSGGALLAFAGAAPASEVLYGAGAESDAASPSILYVLDPASGAAVQTIGAIGFTVTGLAVDPTDGTLYGSTGRATGVTNPGHLIRIDRTTGAGVLIGDLRPDDGTAADLTFAPDGAMFGWIVPANDLATIDKASGAASVVGDSGLPTQGSSLASSPGGTLFLAGLDHRPLYTVDRATGAPTPVGTLNGTDGLRIAAMSFNAAGTLFGAWLDYGSTGPRPSRLVTIDTATAAITFLGPSVNRLDAIAFVERFDRKVTLDAAKAKAKSAGKGSLVVSKGQRARLSGKVTAPRECEANQTVELQRKKPKKKAFKTFKRVRTNAAGRFSAKAKIKKTYLYRALLAETLACDTAASARKKVKVKKNK